MTQAQTVVAVGIASPCPAQVLMVDRVCRYKSLSSHAVTHPMQVIVCNTMVTQSRRTQKSIVNHDRSAFGGKLELRSTSAM